MGSLINTRAAAMVAVRRSYQELFGIGAGPAGNYGEYSVGNVFPGDPRASGVGGYVGLERLLETRRRHPDVVIQASEQQLREVRRGLRRGHV